MWPQLQDGYEHILQNDSYGTFEGNHITIHPYIHIYIHTYIHTYICGHSCKTAMNTFRKMIHMAHSKERTNNSEITLRLCICMVCMRVYTHDMHGMYSPYVCMVYMHVYMHSNSEIIRRLSQPMHVYHWYMHRYCAYIHAYILCIYSLYIPYICMDSYGTFEGKDEQFRHYP